MARLTGRAIMATSLIFILVLGLLGFSMGAASGALRAFLAPIAVTPAESLLDSSTFSLKVAETADRRLVKSPTQPGSDDRKEHADSNYVPPGYLKVFGDEFGGAQLDSQKWWTRYIYDDGKLDFLNDEQQRYRENNNHVMTGHTVTLMARKTVGDGAAADGGYGEAREMFVTGYEQLQLVYIEPVNLDDMTMAGLNHLSTLDPKLKFEHGNRVITIVEDGKAARALDVPDGNEAKPWGIFTANALMAAEAASPAVRAKSSEEDYQAVFSGITAKLDGFNLRPWQSGQVVGDI